MPKEKSSLSSVLNNLVRNNNEFTTDEQVIYCKSCEKSVDF